MCNLENFHWKMAPYEWLIVTLIVWELAWKAIAMWKAARNKEAIWYVCLLLINTLGILPIIYMLMKSKGKMSDEL
jgi:hypothetical protein